MSRTSFRRSFGLLFVNCHIGVTFIKKTGSIMMMRTAAILALFSSPVAHAFAPIFYTAQKVSFMRLAQKKLTSIVPALLDI
jgi:hypothetical protein